MYSGRTFRFVRLHQAAPALCCGARARRPHLSFEASLQLTSRLTDLTMSDPLACPKCQYVRTPADSQPLTECPSCGVVFSSIKRIVDYGEAAASVRSAERQQVTLFGLRAVVALTICAVGFAIALGFGSCSSRSGISTPIYDASSAQFACEGFVRDRLKAPAAADFSPFSQMSISGIGAGPWTVRGYVDATNSFGAKLRSNFTCIVQFEGNRASLISVSLS